MYNRKKRLFLTAVCLSLGLLTGCNVGDTKNYKQAAQDLEQGNYEAALEEYETAISEGVKPAQSYRGAGVAKFAVCICFFGHKNHAPFYCDYNAKNYHIQWKISEKRA